jgi:hypothetical protein
MTAVSTSGGAPEISSGRIRAALASYFALSLRASAPGSAPKTSYQVMPGSMAPPRSRPPEQEAAPASSAGRWMGRAGYMMTSAR